MAFKGGRTSFRFSAISISIVFLFSVIAVCDTDAYTVSRGEDFETVDFVEEVSTNVTGWGSGEISLPRTNLTLLSSTDSYTSRRVQVDGDLLYLFGPYTFEIYNISNLLEPQYLYRFYPDDDGGTGLGYVYAGYAYITPQDNKVIVVNVTDPTSPEQVSEYPANKVRDVWVDGACLYIPTHYDGLHIVNITNPSSPSLITKVIDPTLEPRCVVKEGDYAYLMSVDPDDGTDFLGILNMTDVHNPVQVCQLADCEYYDAFSYYRLIDVEGSMLAFCRHSYTEEDYEISIMLYDLTDIMNPSLLTCIPLLHEFPRQVEINGNALLTNRAIYDIADPENPSLVTEFAQIGGVFVSGNHISGNHIFLATSDGFQILEMSDNLEPSLISHETLPGRDICLTRSTAFVAVGDGGLQSVDVANPASPEVLDFVDMVNIRRVFVSGCTAFVTEYDGLRTFDVRNPSSISELGSYTGLTAAEGVFVVDNSAYVTDSSGLTVLDVTNLDNPTVCGTYDTPSDAYDVWSDGRYAYVAAGEDGLIIVDITDPWHPTGVSSIDTTGVALHLDVAGPHVFVADNESGVQVFSVATPTHPRLISSYDTPGSAQEVYASGNELYVSDETSGVLILNMTTPQNPTFLDSLSVYGGSLALCADLEHVYSVGNLGCDIIQVRLIRGRGFVPLAVAESDTLFTPRQGESVVRTIIHVNDSQPVGTDIGYFVSADDGNHWTGITSETLVSIDHPGSDLRWMAELSTSVFNVTPSIYSINITCKVLLANVHLLSPYYGQHVNTSSPTFQWRWFSVDNSYLWYYGAFLLQIDTSQDFDSSDLTNLTVDLDEGEEFEWTISEVLADGVHYWRVAAIDEEEESGLFSAVSTFIVDTTLTTTTTPSGWALPPDYMFVIGACGAVALVVIALIWNRRRI